MMKKVESVRIYFALLGFLVFIAATNRWLVADPDMSIYRFDSVSYLEIARHYPNFPGFIDIRQGYPEMPVEEAARAEIPHHHAQRFFFPYLAGALSRVTGVAEERVFALTTALFFLLAAIFVLLCLRSYFCDPWITLLLSVCYFANPYVARFYLVVPTYLGDVAFHLGFWILLWGLVKKGGGWVLLGVTICCLGRQTGILLLPGIWVIFMDDLRAKNAKAWLALITATVFAVVIYVVTGRVASKFSPHSINLAHLVGFWGWITGNGLPGHSREGLSLLDSAKVLVVFFFRLFLSMAPFLALLVVSACLRPVRLLRDRMVLGLLLLALAVITQPVLAGPSITGDTIVRLGALSFPALTLLVAVLTKQAERRERPVSDRRIYAMVGLMAITMGSFHHRYSLMAFVPGGQWLFTLVFLTSTFCLYFVWKRLAFSVGEQ